MYQLFLISFLCARRPAGQPQQPLPGMCYPVWICVILCV